MRHLNPLALVLVLTLPLLTPLSFVTAAWIQETWSITQMNTHFMGASSGQGDGTWPTDSGFPSTATFILRQSFRKGPAVGGIFRESARVERYDVQCGRTWMPQMGGGVVVDGGDMGGDEDGDGEDEWVLCEEGRNSSLGFRFRFGGLGEGGVAGPMGFSLVVGGVG
ncbi:hypothetical protein EG328_007582 [Venturia inaequalis]|uniref:Uncharacterized protein n=1 Tax=Venturia inaequalis TaxID=5025 RepID=A0A8H3Z4S1_VENIN|nr:hypothetical protein EG328_007582 [Venturia inaequalis]